MPQYLVCNYLPDNFDPSTVPEAMMEEIHALNREMIAAGARKFACGISPAAKAKTVRKQPDDGARTLHTEEGSTLSPPRRRYGTPKTFPSGNVPQRSCPYEFTFSIATPIDSAHGSILLIER